MIAILTFGEDELPKVQFITDHKEGDRTIAERINQRPYGELRAWVIEDLIHQPILITSYGKSDLPPIW